MTRNKIAPDTMAILEFLAEGHRPKDISETLGVPVSVVYNAKKNHKYVIAEIQGKKPDGSPARFAPGCGAETIAKMERAEDAGWATRPPYGGNGRKSETQHCGTISGD